MGRKSRNRRFLRLLIASILVIMGFLGLLFILAPGVRFLVQEELERLTRGGKRLLGWGRPEVFPEERRIREEVILKKMEEANASQDWTALVPEYPRPKKWEGMAEEERLKVLRRSPEFGEIEKAFLQYLREREDLLMPEPPIPSARDAWELPHRKDSGAQRIIEGLLSSKGKPPSARPLEENLQLGIQGPVVARKILQRPSPPQIKVRVETEIELTFWVLPNGIVDRAIPSVKGDAELERLAIQYMKQWRFAPLPEEQPQVEEWGTIPIRFKLQ